MDFVEGVAAQMFTEELSELVSCTRESLSVCVPLSYFKKNACVFVCVYYREREVKRREGRRDKEKREVLLFLSDLG